MTLPARSEASSVTALRQAGSLELARAGILNPELDAELLLAHVLDVSHGRLRAMVALDSAVDAADASRFDAAIARRAAREPLQHITGEAYFRTLTLAVGPGVFVPRPETEVLAGMAIDALSAVANPSPLAVDLGTGSGAIALSLATEVQHARVIGVENSADAFDWAQRNVDAVRGAAAARTSGAARIVVPDIRVVFEDLASALPELDGTVDVVVSNPPYIPTDAVPRDPEVRLHDPAAALYGGPDGLDPMRAVSRTALRLLHPGGQLLVEHGDVQGEAVRELLHAAGWQATATHRDLTGRDRVTTAIRPAGGSAA